MKKMSNKKGFTLIEMLIVVAIIAILVAIAIPTFSSALNKAKVATDKANVRAWYAEKVIAVMLEEGTFEEASSSEKLPDGTDLKYGTVLIEKKDTNSDGVDDYVVTYTAKTNNDADKLVLTYEGFKVG